MQPFFFGRSQAPLFGLYHPPQSRSIRNAGVVLCYPIGHEYLRALRSFRNLAVQLGRAGFHVLRFDYFGSGDSAGDADEAYVRDWRENLATAIEELKDMSGVSRVSLVGLRFGATLAALTAAERTDVNRAILCDPVVSGRTYIDDLLALQERWFKTRPRVRGARAVSDELIGFPLTPKMRSELEQVDLRSMDTCATGRVQIVMSEERAAYVEMREHFLKIGVRPGMRTAAGTDDWDRVDNVHTILLAHDMNQTVVELLTGGLS